VFTASTILIVTVDVLVFKRLASGGQQLPSSFANTVSTFSQGTPVSSTDKTNRYDITAILLKVVLNTINY
jgi:hypothetical protein